MELWLPTGNWNGKFLAVGNGGWAGSISFDDKGESEEVPIWSYKVENGQYVALEQLV